MQHLVMTTEVRKTTSDVELNILDAFECYGQITLLDLRRLFLLVTKNFFSNSSNFPPSLWPLYADKLKNYTYSDPLVDPERKHAPTLYIDLSEQYADNAGKLELKSEGQFPRVIIDVSDFNYADPGILNLTSEILRDGSGSKQAVYVKTGVTWTIDASTFGDAAALGQLIASCFTGLRPFFLKKLNLDAYIPISLTKPKSINPQESKMIFRSVFAVALTFQTTWETRLESLRLGGSSISLNPQ